MKQGPTIVISEPFVKYELEGSVFFLTDEAFMKLSIARWRFLERVIRSHTRLTTQTIEMIDSVKQNGRFIAAVPLTIWLPKGALTFEERLLKNGFYLLKMEMYPV